MEVFIFLSRPDTSNSRVDFSTDGSSRPDRIVTIRRDICSFPGSSTSGSRAYFLFKLHDPTSGESGRQQQLTTRLSSCILDMCGNCLTIYSFNMNSLRASSAAKFDSKDRISSLNIAFYIEFFLAIEGLTINLWLLRRKIKFAFRQGRLGGRKEQKNIKFASY